MLRLTLLLYSTAVSQLLVVMLLYRILVVYRCTIGVPGNLGAGTNNQYYRTPFIYVP